MYGIYSIYNNNELIYIGKTNNFYTRLKTHMSQQPWSNEITHISIAKCKTKVDMDLYEKYYINKLSPKYNKAIVYNEIPTFAVEELNFIMFTLEDFLKINKPQNENTDNINKSYEKRKQEISELLKTSFEIKEGSKIDFLNSNNILYHWWNSMKTTIDFLHIDGDIKFFNQILRGVKENRYEFIFENSEEIFRNFDLHSLGLNIDSYSVSAKRISKGFTRVNFILGICMNPITKDVTVRVNQYMIEEYFDKYFIY